MNANKILSILPHRYPFLLVDKVIDLVPGESITGIKNISINEPFFQGHFPGNPIYPGVMIIESLAQLAALMYCSEIELLEQGSIADHVGYLVGIEKFRLRKLTYPGDTLRLYAEKEETFLNVTQVRVEAKREDECIAQGVILVTRK